MKKLIIILVPFTFIACNKIAPSLDITSAVSTKYRSNFISLKTGKCCKVEYAFKRKHSEGIFTKGCFGVRNKCDNKTYLLFLATKENKRITKKSIEEAAEELATYINRIKKVRGRPALKLIFTKDMNGYKREPYFKDKVLFLMEVTIFPLKTK